MKLYTILLIVVLAGCSQAQNVACVNAYYTYLHVKTDSATHYTGYSCTAYTQGTGFSSQQLSDSIVFDSACCNELTVMHRNFSVNFDKYDWLITVHPDGKQIKIKDISRYQHSEKMPDYQIEDGTKCINSFSYNINGVSRTVPSNKLTSGAADYGYVGFTY
jgi:hypothetical protein